MARSWKHLVRQNSGGQALSAAQHGQSSVLDAPFFIEAQSSIDAAAAAPPRSPASPCAKVTCSPANFATAAQADTTGTNTIATATSPEIIVRSRGKRGNLRRAISAVALEWSMQITVRGKALDDSRCFEFRISGDGFW